MKTDADYYDTHQRRGCIFIFITALARIAGLTTLLLLAFLTYVEWVVEGPKNFTIYVTVTTIIVGYLELLWLLDKCVTCCICCFRGETCLYWTCCIPIDNWVKTILYTGLSIPFLVPTWFLTFIRFDIKVVGILLIITGLLYLIKTFKYTTTNPDDYKEDDEIFDASKSATRPSITTQTSSSGLNTANRPSTLPINQKSNLKH